MNFVGWGISAANGSVFEPTFFVRVSEYWEGFEQY